MLYLQDDYKIWAKRYGLEIKSRPCLKCKEIFKTTIAVAIKGYRGLRAPLHACGPKYAYTIFVPVASDEIDFWIDFRYGFHKRIQS